MDDASQMDDRGTADLLYCLGIDTKKLAEDRALSFAKSSIPCSVECGKSRRLIIIHNQLETLEILGQELLFIIGHWLGHWIPKQLLSTDEKHLGHCLALIFSSDAEVTAMTPGGVSMHSSDMRSSLGSSCPPETLRSSVDLGEFGGDRKMEAGYGNSVMNPAEHWIVASVMRSDSMIKILRSPILDKLEDFNSEPSDICNDGRAPTDLEQDMQAISSQICTSYTIGRTLSSVTSSLPAVTDQFDTCSSSGPFDYTGVLHCSWSIGTPHFTLSVAGQNGLYVAHTGKVGFPNVKSSDCIYFFYFRPDGLKVNDYVASSSDTVVGAMRVSTSVSLCPNNSRIREREFVLFGLHDDNIFDSKRFVHSDKKSRKLSKVTGLLKGVPLKRSGTFSFMSGSSVSSEKSPDPYSSLHLQGGLNFLDNNLPPNLELAAVVVKGHLGDDDVHEVDELGGWGLKFLKKAKSQLEFSHVECCQQHPGDCFMSMDIIVPVGVHGGPRTINGGPSTLIERWKSGGQCNCGGWDVGCPVKLLHPGPGKEEGSLDFDSQGECRSFAIFPQGSKEGTPWLRIVNLQEGVYEISFQSSLTALQCFAIAMAVVHCRSQSRWPKHVDY